MLSKQVLPSSSHVTQSSAQCFVIALGLIGKRIRARRVGQDSDGRPSRSGLCLYVPVSRDFFPSAPTASSSPACYVLLCSGVQLIASCFDVCSLCGGHACGVGFFRVKSEKFA